MVKLFRDSLGYDYLGNWIEREGNSNIETKLLRSWLKKRGDGAHAMHRPAAFG